MAECTPPAPDYVEAVNTSLPAWLNQHCTKCGAGARQKSAKGLKMHLGGGAVQALTDID